MRQKKSKKWVRPIALCAYTHRVEYCWLNAFGAVGRIGVRWHLSCSHPMWGDLITWLRQVICALRLLAVVVCFHYRAQYAWRAVTLASYAFDTVSFRPNWAAYLALGGKRVNGSVASMQNVCGRRRANAWFLSSLLLCFVESIASCRASVHNVCTVCECLVELIKCVHESYASHKLHMFFFTHNEKRE